jgi:type I restriction enzyme S subunit|nr:restriction endonuclease subunit S [Butyricicoccus sp. AF22-28AC]
MELLSVTMNDGVMPRSEIEGKDNSSEDKSNYKVVLTGDMVYNSMRMWQGANGISPCDGIVSPAYTVLMPKIPISNGYFAAFFKSPNLINEFRKNSQGMTSDTWNLKYPQIETIKVCIPALSEQNRVADMLRTLERRIAKQAQLVDNLKKYKRGLLSREFGQQENGDLNNRYVGKLKDYFHLSSGSTPSSTNRAFYSGNIRWVSSGELKPKYLCETSQHISSEAVSSCNLREYPANTLLVAMYGLEAAGVRGTASILSVPATISQACMAIQQTGEIDIEYLYYWYIYNGQWIGIRIAQGTKQQNLSTDTLGNLRIHAPSCSKQKKVCKLLSQIDYLIEKEGQKIDLLSSAKRGLLQQLFI